MITMMIIIIIVIIIIISGSSSSSSSSMFSIIGIILVMNIVSFIPTPSHYAQVVASPF